VGEALKLYPGFSVKKFIMAMPYKDEAIKEKWFSNLRKAGLPE
jgi:hypothetical protein